MKAHLIKCSYSDPDRSALKEAGRALREGKIVVFPTETVYGVGANALDQNACEEIFRIKNRPQDNPLIVHVSSYEMAESVCTLDPGIRKGLSHFWPGPLTIIAPSGAAICKAARAGLPTVGVRFPSAPVARMLIEEAGVPIAAPSANISTRPSITDPAHALEEFSGKVDFVIASGKSPLGIESTVIDLTSKGIRLLRAGSTPVEDLEKVFGDIEVTEAARGVATEERPLSPGTKYLHYSPVTPLYLVAEEQMKSMGHDPRFSEYVFICSSQAGQGITNRKIVLGSDSDLSAVASRLFSALRELDSMGARGGFIHLFPEHGIGLAIGNRIRKASRPLTGEILATLVRS